MVAIWMRITSPGVRIKKARTSRIFLLLVIFFLLLGFWLWRRRIIPGRVEGGDSGEEIDELTRIDATPNAQNHEDCHLGIEPVHGFVATGYSVGRL